MLSEKPLTKGNITSGAHKTYWTDSEPPVSFKPLNENLQADVVIVGGGIAGVSVAYCLCKEGKRVVLVEDGNIGSGETGRTSAHLVCALDDRYFDLERMFGKKGAHLAAESHSAAIAFVKKTCALEKIDCDFKEVKGYLFLHESDKPENLDKEYDAATRAGLSIEKLDHIPGFLKNKNSPCLQFNNQAQFHPLKYINGLCNAIERMGGEIFTNTRATEIDDKGIKTAEGFNVKADYIVVATNSPVNNKFAIHLKQYPHRTYLIGATLKKGILPDALWWDSGDQNAGVFPPYHYIRLINYSDTQDMLLCGGEDHPTGMAESVHAIEGDQYDKIEKWARERFPIGEVIYKWSGQVFEPMDSLAYIGRNPFDKDNVYIVTGDSGNGLTHGTIAGMLISDLICGNENEWEKLYNPSRFKLLKSGNTFLKEAFGGFVEYLKETPKHPVSVDLASIEKGYGRIVEMDKHKFGAYKDENEQLHLVTAECTHLKCIIKWNPDEKTWDCPCHGSRFSFTGEVLNGPANKELNYFKY